MPTGHADVVRLGTILAILAGATATAMIVRKGLRRLRRWQDANATMRIAIGYRASRHNQTPVVRQVMPIPPDAWRCTVAPGYGSTPTTLGFGPGAAWNDTFWNNERMGQLLAQSLAETDPAKRHAMYCEMQTLVHNGSGMVIPAFSNINDGIADNVMGMPTVPLGQLGACEWPEFIWLA